MNPTTFPPAAGALTLFGDAGRIEAVVEQPAAALARDAVAVVCHPHPLHGGTMTNKVVTSCERALRDLGCSTLRFNFRGVGASDGEFDDGIGEGHDLVRICDWVRTTRPGALLVLAGFSFGAFVSMARAADIRPDQLISIAPPVGRWDLAGFRHPHCRWLVLQPDADEVVDAAQVFAWVAQLQPAPSLVRFADTSHFFHGQLLALRAAIQAGVAPLLPPLT